MIDWSEGFSAEYEMQVVDPLTWADIRNVDLVSGDISKDATSDLVESASFTITEDLDDMEPWVRVYLRARQDGSGERVPLFTGLATFPEKSIETVTTWKVDCQSVLKPLQDMLLPRGYYAPAGAGAGFLKGFFSISTAPVEVDGDPPGLTSDIVAEDGESYLSMAQKILKAMNWRIRLDGYGTITICSKETDDSQVLSKNENDIIETSISLSYDWYECPNVFRAITEDGEVAVARDDDPGSKFSTASRGREIWMEDSSADLADDETIAAYAVRRLKEEQTPEIKASYTRRYMPSITAGDTVELNYAKEGLAGLFLVSSQKITLGHGCPVSEDVQESEA